MFHFKDRRGSILVMSIFFMLILFIVASAFLVLLPTEHRAAQRSEVQTKGALVADAGVSEAISWLRFQIAPPDGSDSNEPMASGVYPDESRRTREMGDSWVYRWELIPDEQTFPNGSNPIRAYTIVSKAFRNGTLVREARAEVIQKSLSYYDALYDNWPSNLVMGISSNSAPTGGPVHANDILQLWIKDGGSYWDSAGEPKFTHGLTASGVYDTGSDGFAYYKGNLAGSDANFIPYDDDGPINSRYNRLAAGGRDSMVSGASEVNLPSNTFSLRDAAWGFDAPQALPSGSGVHLNEVDGALQGIYVNGYVEEMELGYGGSQPAGPGTANYGNNSWVKIEQTGDGLNSIDTHEAVTVITLDEAPIPLPAGTIVNGDTLGANTTYQPGTTLVRNADGEFEYFGSELNGVIYVNGDVNDLWGVNKGRRTITVEGDADAGVRHSVRIGGKEDDSTGEFSISAGEKGLIQYGVTDEDGDGVLDPPETGDNVLGIVAHTVSIAAELKHNDQWDTSHPSDNPLYLYAVVLGGITGDGGGYGVEEYDSGNSGYAYRFGSRIVVDARAWGTTSGHGLNSGNTFYDEEAAIQPPPYFPSLPAFEVKSYLDLAAEGEEL